MEFKEIVQQVEVFHNAFGIENNSKPTLLDEAGAKLRFNLMKEENEEYLEAAQKGDLVEIADALGDQLYILCGTLLRHGLQHKIEEIFCEIQRSNMSKLDANGKATGEMDQNQAGGMSTDECARQILAGVASGKTEFGIGGKELLGLKLRRFFPSLFERILRKRSAR